MTRALMVLVLITLAFFGALLVFSPSARLRRRLRKTHSRLVPKVNRPMVRLSVKTPKE